MLSSRAFVLSFLYLFAWSAYAYLLCSPPGSFFISLFCRIQLAGWNVVASFPFLEVCAIGDSLHGVYL